MTKYTLTIETDNTDVIAYVSVLSDILINANESKTLPARVAPALGWFCEQFLAYMSGPFAWMDNRHDRIAAIRDDKIIEHLSAWLNELRAIHQENEKLVNDSLAEIAKELEGAS